MRDVLIHRYFSVDMELVWDADVNSCPDLMTSIQHILSVE
jgi:uncharacterized protein with HEPN domain